MRNVRECKGPYVYAKLYKKAQKAIADGSKSLIKTWSRSSVIIPSFIGLSFAVHNGRRFISVFVKEHMVGYRLGEFSPTKTFKSHSGNKSGSKKTGNKK